MAEEFIMDARPEYDFSDDTSDHAKMSREDQLLRELNSTIQGPMKIPKLKIPESQLETMRKSYEVSCVNDFSDEYHMSEKEREETFQQYSNFKYMLKTKMKHRKLDNYIRAYRTAMDCLEGVAATNGVYPKNEFIKKVLSGKIKVYGLKIPKYIGKDKKEINWGYVSEYIMDRTLDPSDLVKEREVTMFEPVNLETFDDEFEALYGYSPDEVFKHIKPDTKEEMIERSIFDIDVDDSSEKNIVLPLSNKDTKHFMKDNPAMIYHMRDYKKMMRQQKNLSKMYAFEITEDEFAEIENMDRERGYLNGNLLPSFQGSIMDSTAYKRYMYQLEEYEREHTKLEYNGKLRTMDEIEELELKNMLEASGLNVRKFYTYAADERKLRKQAKKDEERVKRLKKELYRTKERIENRNGVNTKKKKKKKKDKTGYKKKARAAINDTLLGGLDYSDFDEYTAAMERWDD